MGVWATRCEQVPPSGPDWLDVVRHRVRGFRVPYLLVVQHHAISSATRLVAPVSLPLQGDVDLLAPRLLIDGTQYRARVLDISAVPVTRLGETVASLAADRDAIMNAIDLILHGYPVR
jgi:CcdB protein